MIKMHQRKLINFEKICIRGVSNPSAQFSFSSFVAHLIFQDCVSDNGITNGTIVLGCDTIYTTLLISHSKKTINKYDALLTMIFVYNQRVYMLSLLMHLIHDIELWISSKWATNELKLNWTERFETPLVDTISFFIVRLFHCMLLHDRFVTVNLYTM